MSTGSARPPTNTGLGLGDRAGGERVSDHGCGGDLFGQRDVAPHRTGAFPGQRRHPRDRVAMSVAPMGSPSPRRIEKQQLGRRHRLLGLEEAAQGRIEVVVAHRVDRRRDDDVPANDAIEERGHAMIISNWCS